MYSRNHRSEDYAIFCQWWEDWGWDAVPYEFIPPNSVVVCDDDDKQLCAVFMYLVDTPTPIIWAENYISDRHFSSGRKEAMELLIDSLFKSSTDLGVNMIMSNIKHAPLARRLERQGFIKGDENLTNYVKVI